MVRYSRNRILKYYFQKQVFSIFLLSTDALMMLFLYIFPVLSKFLVVCWRPSAHMVASICAYGRDRTRIWSPANAWKCRRKLLKGWGIFAASGLPNYVWWGVLTSGLSCCNFAKKTEFSTITKTMTKPIYNRSNEKIFRKSGRVAAKKSNSA